MAGCVLTPDGLMVLEDVSWDLILSEKGVEA